MKLLRILLYFSPSTFSYPLSLVKDIRPLNTSLDTLRIKSRILAY
jgi:hypothetical protein